MGRVGSRPEHVHVDGTHLCRSAQRGVLLSVYQDALGQEENFMARLGYAYHMEPLSNGAIISAGLSATMFQKKLGNDWIAIDDYTQDAAIPNNETSSSTIDLDFGVFIRKPGSFYAGLSATHSNRN